MYKYVYIYHIKPNNVAEAFSVAHVLANYLPLSETEPTYCIPNVPSNCIYLRPINQG